MTTDLLSSTFQGITRGRILEVPENDAHVVVDPGSGLPIACALLCVRDGESLVLEVGDEVLIYRGHGEDVGVVLGRIELDRPRSLSPTSPDVPDEIVLEAKRSLTIRVGDGSITIRRDGRILIKGKDLVSNAQRMNRIKGGAVSIN